jgi:glucosamine--fructose-6-phosphate aminotransferase (isomerizing)
MVRMLQVVCMSLIAGWFGQNRASAGDDEKEVSQTQMLLNQRRHELIDALHRLPTYAGMTLQNRDVCRRVAEKIQSAEHLFVLGKGFGEPIAYEGALKIKEITYMHAEGYSGGALKHGPFALIEKGTPIVLLILDDKHRAFMQTAAHEV